MQQQQRRPPPKARPKKNNRSKCAHLCHQAGQRTGEFLKSIFNLFKQFLVGFEKHAGILLFLFLMFLAGLALLQLGEFIIATSAATRKILDVLALAVEFLNEAWKIVVPALNVIFNIVAGMVNAASTVKSWFTGGSSSSIPSLDLPSTLDISWITTLGAWYDLLGNMKATCAPFTNILYECLFPFRYLANDRVCPVVRHTWGTFLHGPFSFFTGFLFFDDNPNGNNCANPAQFCVCFACYIGLFVSFGLVGAILFLWRFGAIMTLCIRLVEEVWILFRLLLFLCGLVITELFRDSSDRKGQYSLDQLQQQYKYIRAQR